MRTRAVLAGLLGAGTALAGDLVVDAQGGGPHYARDMTLGAAGGTGQPAEGDAFDLDRFPMSPTRKRSPTLANRLNHLLDTAQSAGNTGL